jgi:hypothetical protein
MRKKIIKMVSNEFLKPLQIDDRLFLPKTGLDKDYSSINRVTDGNNDHQFILMIEGYKDSAFDLLKNLIDKKEVDWIALDSKIFPIIFIFRQFLELILKQTLRFEKLIKNEIQSDELGFKTTHSLEKLWEELKPIIQSRYKQYDEITQEGLLEKDNTICDMISELDRLDSGSFAFRYPFEKPKNGTDKIEYSLPKMTIDLQNLQDSMRKLTAYFEGINEQARIELDQKQSTK